VPPAVRPVPLGGAGHPGELEAGEKMKSIYTPVKFSAVFIYGAKSLALFAALMVGIFFALIIKRNFAKRSLERTAKKKAKSDNYSVRIRPATFLKLRVGGNDYDF